VFHVEHAPIHETPPPHGAFFQQTVNVRINDLRGKSSREFRNICYRSATQTSCDSGAITLDSGHDLRVCIHDPTNDTKFRLTLSDYVCQPTRPE